MFISFFLGKVNSMPNLPPGVAASMLHHPQYMATGLAPAAFYGLQQPMYGAYGNTGFEDLAAIHRQASAAGLHTLVGSPAAAAAAQPPPQAASRSLQSAMKGVCKQIVKFSKS